MIAKGKDWKPKDIGEYSDRDTGDIPPHPSRVYRSERNSLYGWDDTQMMGPGPGGGGEVANQTEEGGVGMMIAEGKDWKSQLSTRIETQAIPHQFKN